MAIENIYDPLDAYVNEFKTRFDDVCRETFEALAREAQVDVEANRQTCADIEANGEKLKKVRTTIGWWTALCVALWVVTSAGAVAAVWGFAKGNPTVGVIGIAAAALGLCLLLGKVNPRLRALKDERDNLEQTIRQLTDLAWKQMEPLNRLYDWDIFTRMMTKTVPRLEFDPFFTAQRLEELRAVYNWDDSFNDSRSVLFSHSGLINGNPFVICRTKKMEWGKKTYEGSLDIEWTEYERDSNGKMRSVRRRQTLRASIERPIPKYFQKTRLFYGNTAAPDLTFTRRKSGLASKQKSIGFKYKRSQLRKKMRNLKEDYAMMGNEEFEVAFDTSNRNNNQQHALLFTPLAQNSMMSLLVDDEAGYGDDFDFEKCRMINTIITDHMQGSTLDMDPQQYRNYSFDKASEDFQSVNAAHFRAIYFAFAPLLAIPAYQQIRPHEAFYGTEMKRRSTFWEHEALANFWGAHHFEHPQCVTECILKTEIVGSPDHEATVKVHAHGYRTEARVTYVEVRGGDGRWHDVPVHWREYLPVTGYGSFFMREDDPQLPLDAPQKERIAHIESVMASVGHNLYRRHISSRL